jgi:molecular chaperone HtpG
MPAKIALPAFLKGKLEESTHEAAVQKALKDFGRWFGDESKLTFFPDYTNHGIQHIRQVLDTATNLIPPKARDYFSADDAAALILAVLLHDSALHLSKAGFWYLIKGPKEGASPFAPVPFFDQADWGQAWNEFMFLARRWDDTMLLNVFGEDGTTGAPRAQVRDPFDHWANLNETDNLLIGEFIRKHHPRLAHEMALHGVPGHEAIYLKLDDDLPLAWRDLAGLIARSHGLPLRTSLDYLRETPHFGTTGHRSYQSVHAVYLMTLLRVGDYIQIQGDRTSERIFAYKDIPSLMSRVEHKVHLSDILISANAEDPESLQIDASPKEVAVFLRLKEWLAGIQQELDGSWAVLGEVYGRYKELRKLGLTFRRVRSNLDNVKEFAKTVPYVPDRIRFDVARAELLKLLIGPLYGDDPSYGVRELMQNSIDAVREYDQFVLDNPQYASVPRREQEADVVVELGPLDEEKGYAVMTISDRGIGMTEATIRDYFLRAGASFRQSTEWKSTFEMDGERVKSKVLRSGRFGVGALATFLIAEEIEVKTRHVSSVDGYKFSTTTNTEVISVFRSPLLEVGTLISMRVDAHHYSELLKKTSPTTKRPAFWDWYCLKYPVVKRIHYDIKNRKLVSDNSFQFSADYRDKGWRKLVSLLPYEIYWTLGEAPNLTCNGIFVSDAKKAVRIPAEHLSANEELSFSAESINYPKIAILDPDGKFSLNLMRNSIQDSDYLFGKELVRDLLTELVGWAFLHGPDSAYSHKLLNFNLERWIGYTRTPVLVGKAVDGYVIRLTSLFDAYAIEHVLLLQPGLKIVSDSPQSLVLRLSSSAGDNSFDTPFSDFTPQKAIQTKIKGNYQFRIVVYKHEYASSKAPKTLEIQHGYDRVQLTVEDQEGGWLVMATSGCPNKRFSIIEKVRGEDEDGGRLVRDMNYLEERFYPSGTYLKASGKPWLLDELWQEHLGKNWIPFALEDRIAKFPKAAQFFKERYPQVVPDEAWALLGGKPATGK